MTGAANACVFTAASIVSGLTNDANYKIKSITEQKVTLVPGGLHQHNFLLLTAKRLLFHCGSPFLGPYKNICPLMLRTYFTLTPIVWPLSRAKLIALKLSKIPT